MIKNTVAIIIPVYKDDLSQHEILSLKQCLNVLKNYDIFFVTPHDLNLSQYSTHCVNVNYKTITFNASYFENIEGYNKLMLSTHFYKKFLEYKFILIHQLDAYVFKDELLFWCSKNYDFIGAPQTPHKNRANEIQFLKTYSRILYFLNFFFKINHRISNVGNGGLSLRKTKSCYWLLKLFNHSVKKWGSNNEDGFYKYWGNVLYPFIKLPSDDVALKFSIEIEPQRSLKKLNLILPFGCHAFEKYEWDIWKPYILDKTSGE